MRIWFALVFCCIAACEEQQPPIVVRFEPIDAAAQRPKTPAADAAAAAPTTATATATAKSADAGVAAAPSAKAGGDKAAPPKLDDKVATDCKKATDCVAEPDGCCACSSGGKQRAIAKKGVAAAQAAMKKECGDKVACVMMLSNDPSCQKQPACVAGHCTLK
jgi:hypothetical protein